MPSTAPTKKKTAAKVATKAPKKVDKSAQTATGPLARQRAEHSTKEKLVDTLLGVLDHVKKSDEAKDDVKARFLALSNQKLLRLHGVASELREKFGTADQAAEALAQLLGRAKDAPYIAKLKSFAPAKLLDLIHVAQKKDVRNKKRAAAA